MYMRRLLHAFAPGLTQEREEAAAHPQSGRSLTCCIFLSVDVRGLWTANGLQQALTWKVTASGQSLGWFARPTM